MMAYAGMPIEQVADRLGHRDRRMLQKHYQHRIKPTIGGAHVLSSVFEQGQASASDRSIRSQPVQPTCHIYGFSPYY